MKIIPDVIFDKKGNRIRVIKANEVFFTSKSRKEYILHIEKEERITSIAESDLIEEDGRYIITKDVLNNFSDI